MTTAPAKPPTVTAKVGAGGALVITETQVTTTKVLPPAGWIIGSGTATLTLPDGSVLQTPIIAGGTGGGGTNVYPLKMPPGVTDGAAVTIGTGPNRIQLNLSNEGGTTIQAEFVVIVQPASGGSPIVLAGPLTVSEFSGFSPSQIFTIMHDLGPLTTLTIQGTGAGLQSLWMNAVTSDYFPLCTQTQTDSRGGPNINATNTWISNGASSIVWGQPVAVTPPATISNIPALINGIAKTDTLSNLLGATPVGGTLTLPAGQFGGSGIAPNACTIVGAGAGQTILSAQGITTVQQKGIITPDSPVAQGVTIEGMTLTGAFNSGAGNYTGAIRDDTGGGVVSNCEFTKNQMGIFSVSGNWTVTACNFHDNGSGEGQTHEMYFQADGANTVTLNQCISTQGMQSTHALKSRAATTVVNGGTFTSGGNSNGGICGSIVDVPNGGMLTATGATFNLLPNSANILFLGYAEENNTNAQYGVTVKMNNCVFIDGTGTGGKIEVNTANVANATLDVTGSTYTGAVPPSIAGFSEVIGTIAKAA